jgi:hypothetical protein
MRGGILAYPQFFMVPWLWAGRVESEREAGVMQWPSKLS